MTTIEIISRIKTLLGSDLQTKKAPEYPDSITGLMAIRKGTIKYMVEGGNSEGPLRGLNLANTGLTDEQWATIIAWIAPEKLEALNLSGNRLESIVIPGSFKALKTLEISGNENLKGISFEEGLSDLERLVLRDNKCRRLVFPKGFKRLKYLEAGRNRLNKVDFEGEMPLLECLDLSGNEIKNIDVRQIDLFPNLKYWYLNGNPLNESLKVYQTERGANYKEAFGRLKKDFDKGDRVKNEEYKVIIVGDGTAGKTCLVNRMLYNSFKEEDSTHGITIQKYIDQEDRFRFPYTLNLWDFGGQDIYHTTHRLFLQSNAVYLLVWNKNTEGQDTSKAKSGRKWKDYKNRKVEYWMQYIYVHGKGSPILLVQTHKEKHEGYRWKGKADILKKYEGLIDYIDFAAVDSKPDDEGDENRGGFRNMMSRLQEAIYTLGREEYLPKHWVEIKQFLEDKTPKLQAKSRGEFLTTEDATIDYQDYDTYARSLGVEDPKRLLTHWLVPTGTVFFKEGYFENKIILNQEWAIRAIYVLFERNEDLGGCYYEIKENTGKFSGKDLMTYWEKYGQNERALFVDYMLACGMCYEVKKERYEAKAFEERLFIAPEMLPKKRPDNFAIQEKEWQDDKQKVLRLRYDYNFPHYHYFQQFLVRTQADVEQMTDFYRYGIRIYDSGAYALVEFDEKHKRIVVRISPNGKKLLERIYNRFKDIHRDGEVNFFVGLGEHPMILFSKIDSLKGQSVLAADRLEAEDGELVAASIYSPFFSIDEKEVFKGIREEDLSKPKLSKPSDFPKIYFSYAWGDSKEIGESREKLVADLFQSLKDANFNVFRDKEDLNFMDSIDQFMKDVSGADQVFIFLSSKYFKSINCMTELDRIVKKCETDKEKFRERVILIPVEWLSFHKTEVVTDYLKFWAEQRDHLIKQRKIREKFSAGLSAQEESRLRLIKNLISDSFTSTTSWIADFNQSSKGVLSSQDFKKVKDLLNERLQPLAKTAPSSADSIPDWVANFTQSLQSIENKLDKTHQFITKDLLGEIQLSTSQYGELKTALNAIQSASEESAQNLLHDIQTQLEQTKNLPTQIEKIWKTISTQSGDMDVKGKLKWAIAIIPGILYYETNTELPLVKWARKFWKNGIIL